MFTAANTAIVVPAVGAVLAVIVVPVWLPILERVLTKLAHCVAVTVPAAATVPMAVWPQPELVAPVLHVALTFAPAVVLTNPL